MEVGKLLRLAREGAGLDQAGLARKAATSRSQVSRYESGAVSPTVQTLDRLLAACGLQARVALEPLLADLDERVDEVLAGQVELNTAELPALVQTLRDEPDAPHGTPYGSRPVRKGPVTWAFDGATALQLQGLAVPGRTTALAVVLDEAARWWLRAIGAQAMSSKGWAVHWLEGDEQVLAEATRHGFFSLVTMLSLRIVPELPPTVQLAVPWSDQPVPVATVDAVEQGIPQYAELLARLRERRARDVA